MTRVLDRHLVSGLAWTGVVKWSSQALSWASTLIVVRILSPEDYGIMGMSAVYLALVAIVNESGLSVSVVSNKHLTDTQLAQLNRLCTLFGAGALAVSCLAAVPMARFFRSPDLAWVLVAMSTTFVITSFKTVPSALLQRDLDFKTLALAEGLQAFAQTLAVVLFAILGFRFWALVLGGIAGTIVSTTLVLAKRRCAFAWPRMSVIGDAFRYGRQVLGGQLAWYVVTNADLLIIGRVLGQAAVGVYSLVSSIAATPVEKVASLVVRVAFPMFARVRDDLPALRRYLLTLTEGLALICFPLAVGLALEADKFVPVVLGDKWGAAVGPLMLLAVLGGMRSVSPLISQVLLSIGGARFAMHIGVLMAIIAPVAFYIGAIQMGLTGVAAGWLVSFALTAPPVYWVVMRRIELSGRSYLRALWPAVSGCLAMATAILLARWLCQESGVDPVRSFLIETAGGGVGYLGTVLTLHRRRLSSFVSMVRQREAGAATLGDHPEGASGPGQSA